MAKKPSDAGFLLFKYRVNTTSLLVIKAVEGALAMPHGLFLVHRPKFFVVLPKQVILSCFIKLPSF
jgi:hypothetical protein